MTRLDPARSPCRRHPCSVEHAEMVRDYRERAEAWDREAESVTMGHAREMALYREDHPRPTFADHLANYRVDISSSDD